MYYHASPVEGITTLIPHVSNHGKAQIYFSEKAENVLVYLSNAIEKYCKEVAFIPDQHYTKWASYGFTKEGILRVEEYYPNATEETYKGVSGWLYWVSELPNGKKLKDIPFVATSTEPVSVDGCTFIPDAYEALLQAEAEGKIVIQRYEENSPTKMDWIKRTIISEYESAAEQPDYRLFLEAKFADILKNK